MTYIKKLVMHGFKSFPKKTELPFTSGINVILGPNGSGKSNISDALCFVLGRLSIKSMRAAKAKNLIFLGTKAASPSKEASVEIVFDNSNNAFSLNEKEVSIKRIVRRNGQSVYKINNNTKTRQEILGLLAQAGIDPNGFNIILQGEIQNFVRMQTDDRRGIVEEVAGISVYELRKGKSLKELDKTEERLKEVMAILRERTAYLNNLEKERQEALRFKKLEKDVKKFKASIINHDLTKKSKEKQNINQEIEKKNKEIEKIRKIIIIFKSEIEKLETKIKNINYTVKDSTGLEQEKLNNEIANLRADIAGLRVKLENNEKKVITVKNQKINFESTLRETEISVRELNQEFPTVETKEKELKSKKRELEELEEKRKKFYMIKSELKSLQERIEDKKDLLANYESESKFTLKQLENLSLELFDNKTDSNKLNELKLILNQKKESLENLKLRERELEKLIHTDEYEIENQKKMINKISSMDLCPLCRNKITGEHIGCIKKEVLPKIDSLKNEIDKFDKELTEIYSKKDLLNNDIDTLSSEILKRQSDLLNLKTIEEKTNQIKVLNEKIQTVKQELIDLVRRRNSLEKDSESFLNIEEKYETIKLEVQEITLRSKENLDSEISFKQRETERLEISIRQLNTEEKDLIQEVQELKNLLSKKETLLDKKKKLEEELTKKFEKLISERDDFQNKIRESENNLSIKNNQIYNVEQIINNFKIDKARINAELENLETEMLEFPNIELIKASKEILETKLNKTQEILSRIGSVNLRSLEVYDSIKEEYDKIRDKVEIISKEKQGILKIIHEIDIKKKKSFLNTLNELNEIFSRNFSQLSTKGQVTLELENKKDPFDGGINIIVKTGHGKYFDVKSLSGGEQTIVALSLIFAIQELKPYCFYILDEIDAALDKRNSERLGALLKKYMQKGQYIVITHNDEIITNATNIFGISMHDGVSKIVSLKI